jgi:hypothetical protein
MYGLFSFVIYYETTLGTPKISPDCLFIWGSLGPWAGEVNPDRQPHGVGRIYSPLPTNKASIA